MIFAWLGFFYYIQVIDCCVSSTTLLLYFHLWETYETFLEVVPELFYMNLVIPQDCLMKVQQAGAI